MSLETCKIVSYDIELLFKDPKFIKLYNEKCNITSKCYIDYQSKLGLISCPDMKSNIKYTSDLFWSFLISVSILFVIIYFTSYISRSRHL